MKRIDLVGQRFGKLTVSKEVGKTKSGNYKFLCKCDCGVEKTISSNSLRNSKQTSCGCIQTTHNFTRDQKSKNRSGEFRFYHRYQNIKDRCKNKNNASYHNYGFRGIKCLWKSFEDFRDDMYESYQLHIKEFGVNNTSIDRINNNGNYCKENCRWATTKEQRRNSRQNIYFIFRGEKLALIEIAEQTGVRYSLLVKRIYAGWTLEKALKTPRQEKAHKNV